MHGSVAAQARDVFAGAALGGALLRSVISRGLVWLGRYGRVG